MPIVTTNHNEFPDEVPSEPSFPLGQRPLHEYVAPDGVRAKQRQETSTERSHAKASC